MRPQLSSPWHTRPGSSSSESLPESYGAFHNGKAVAVAKRVKMCPILLKDDISANYSTTSIKRVHILEWRSSTLRSCSTCGHEPMHNTLIFTELCFRTSDMAPPNSSPSPHSLAQPSGCSFLRCGQIAQDKLPMDFIKTKWMSGSHIESHCFHLCEMLWGHSHVQCFDPISVGPFQTFTPSETKWQSTTTLAKVVLPVHLFCSLLLRNTALNTYSLGFATLAHQVPPEALPFWPSEALFRIRQTTTTTLNTKKKTYKYEHKKTHVLP